MKLYAVAVYSTAELGKNTTCLGVGTLFAESESDAESIRRRQIDNDDTSFLHGWYKHLIVADEIPKEDIKKAQENQ